MPNMNAYDAKAWEDIRRRKSKPPGRRRVRHAVPSTVKDTANKAASSARVTLQSAPGAARFQEVFLNSLGGLHRPDVAVVRGQRPRSGDRQVVCEGRS